MLKNLTLKWTLTIVLGTVLAIGCGLNPANNDPLFPEGKSKPSCSFSRGLTKIYGPTITNIDALYLNPKLYLSTEYKVLRSGTHLNESCDQKTQKVGEFFLANTGLGVDYVKVEVQLDFDASKMFKSGQERVGPLAQSFVLDGSIKGRLERTNNKKIEQSPSGIIWESTGLIRTTIDLKCDSLYKFELNPRCQDLSCMPVFKMTESPQKCTFSTGKLAASGYPDIFTVKSMSGHLIKERDPFGDMLYLLRIEEIQ